MAPAPRFHNGRMVDGIDAAEPTLHRQARCHRIGALPVTEARVHRLSPEKAFRREHSLDRLAPPKGLSMQNHAKCMETCRGAKSRRPRAPRIGAWRRALRGEKAPAGERRAPHRHILQGGVSMSAHRVFIRAPQNAIFAPPCGELPCTTRIAQLEMPCRNGI